MNRRIAIVLPFLELGGAERISLTLAEEMLRTGFAVDIVLAQARGPLLDAVPPGARLVDLGAQSLRRSITPMWQYFRQVRPFAAFANVWPLTLIAAVTAKLASGRTQILTMHQNSLTSQYVDGRGHSRLAMKAALRLELALAARVIGCSGGVVEDLAHLAGVSADRFQVIPNPVKISSDVSSRELEAAEQLWAVPRGRRILAVGNLKPQKNFTLLLNAYAAMDKGDADRLIVIGEGPLRGELEEQVTKLGLDWWVRLPGQSRCLEAYYRTADLFVMSSRHEGLPTVLIEALGFGLPVVSTDCPSGPREILADGRFGTLVQMNNPAALAQAMEKALSGPVDRAALKSRADDFAPGTISRKLLGLLADGGLA